VLKRAGFSLKILFKVIYAILKQETFFLNSFIKILAYIKTLDARRTNLCQKWETP
jgi:hypothetical protein